MALRSQPTWINQRGSVRAAQGQEAVRRTVDRELAVADAHPRIVRVREVHLSWSELSPLLEQLDVATIAGDRSAVLQLISMLVSEYSAPAMVNQRIA